MTFDSEHVVAMRRPVLTTLLSS